MNKLKKTITTFGVAAALTFGGAAAANAYTANTVGWTTKCYGPDLWNVRIDWIDYSFWEEIAYPWPKDHYRYTATSLKQYHNPYCMSVSYA